MGVRGIVQDKQYKWGLYSWFFNNDIKSNFFFRPFVFIYDVNSALIFLTLLNFSQLIKCLDLIYYGLFGYWCNM
jgi:hypothetical protein